MVFVTKHDSGVKTFLSPFIMTYSISFIIEPLETLSISLIKDFLQWNRIPIYILPQQGVECKDIGAKTQKDAIKLKWVYY